MNNKISIAETCLYLLSFFSFVGVAYAFMNYGALTSSPYKQNPSFFGVVVFPSAMSLLFGFAFHFCAKFLKLGSAKAWRYSIVLLSLFLIKSLIVLLGISLIAGLVGMVLSSIGLWALLQKESRAFIRPPNVTS